VVGLSLGRGMVHGGVYRQFGLICCCESGHGASQRTEILDCAVRLDEMGSDVVVVSDLDMRVFVVGYEVVGGEQELAGLVQGKPDGC